MKRLAAKEKTTQLGRSHLAHRASGPTRSYLQTRVRASRLYQAAFILAFIELTRRLHQAYRQAYDKQAADKVLPQNPIPPSPGDVKKDFYKQYGQKLNDCIKKLFGRDARRVPQQTLNNAPALDARLNGKQVGALSKTGPAIGNSKPFQGRYGTVFIASETYNGTASYTMDEIFRTYGHELGNVLDMRLNPNVGQARYGRVYGDPKSTIDTDTGEAIEECVFGPRVR